MNKQDLVQRVRKLQHELDLLLDAVIALDELSPIVANVETDDNDWLSPADAAKHLGISKTTFFRWVKDGALPPGVRFSSRERRWRIKDFITWQDKKGA